MRTFLAGFLLLSGLWAQGPTLPNAVPMPTPEVQWLDSHGKPLAGAKLCTYAANSSTPLATYTDSTAGTSNTNPVILDPYGRASVWVGPQLYKFVLRTGGDGTCSTGAVQWTQDNVTDTTLYFVQWVKTAGTATLISYTAPWTGGTAETLAAKMARYIDVRDFGAKGDSSQDDTAAIQAAIDTACTDSGHAVFLPAGQYQVTALVAHCSGIVMNGEGMGGQQDFPPAVGSTLVSPAGNAGPMFTADPLYADTSIALRGIALNNLTFDVTASPTMPIVIKLRSTSNMPAWSNVTVYGNVGTALDIDGSTSPGAQISEGLQFENLYVYGGMTTSGVYAGGMIAPMVRVSATNETLFHGGKIFFQGTTHDATSGGAVIPLVLIQSSTSIPFGSVMGITFDGVSTSTAYVHYRVQGVGTVSPWFIRWSNCIFEGYDVGIAVNDASPQPSVAARELYIEKSNEFKASVQASSKRVNADYLEQSYIGIGSAFGAYPNGYAPVTLGAHTAANEVHGAGGSQDCVHNYVSAGANICHEGDYYVAGFYVDPMIVARAPTNPSVEAWDTTSTIKVRLQASHAILGGFVATSTNHPLYFGANATPWGSISTAGAWSITGPSWSITNGTYPSSKAWYVDSAGLATTRPAENNTSVWTINGLASNAPNDCIRFADASLGGQTLGKAYLAFCTRAASQERKFVVSVSDSGGTARNAITGNEDGTFSPGTFAAATLPAAANGSFAYCSDCTVADPCAGGGTGAFAKRLAGVWVCN